MAYLKSQILKSMFGSKTILGIACIVLSLIICFALTPLFNDAITARTLSVEKDNVFLENMVIKILEVLPYQMNR